MLSDPVQDNLSKAVEIGQEHEMAVTKVIPALLFPSRLSEEAIQSLAFRQFICYKVAAST